MKKKIKLLILPIILTILFLIIYFFIYPMVKSKKAIETIFSNFETGLTNLKIEYQKEEVDAKEFGAAKAYSYVSNDKILKIYVYRKNSHKFKEGLKQGYIIGKNKTLKLYGIFTNNCVLFLQSGYPSDAQILSLFTALSEDYYNNI